MEQTEQGLFFPLGLDLTGLRRDFREATSLGAAFGSTLTRAFGDIAVKGRSLSSVISNLVLSLSKSALSSSLRGLQKTVGGFFGDSLGSIFGAGRSNEGASGSIARFARGGIINSPTLFPSSSNSVGLMGEAGPEAILPLARGADGKLGIRARDNDRQFVVNFNITTPDSNSFQQSEGQITAMMGRAIMRAKRNL